MSAPPEPLRLFLVAGEHSGDQLGGKLIPALRARAGGPVEIAGIGGPAMAEEGVTSLFPLSEVAVMGPFAIIPRLPRIVRRIRETVAAALAMRPHALVIMDSPEFTHPIAKRVRRRMPGLPVVDYVSPSVWAWRPGRARRMRRYIDHVLAILPFEPAVHERLGGPSCTYVGHPLIERLDWMRGLDPGALAKSLGIASERSVLLVAPGSRSNEIKRMMAPYGQALRLIIERHGPVEVVIPAVESVRDLIEMAIADWPLRPHLVEGETAKFQAFRLATAALATSGTVTLELALAGTPMVVGYKTDPVSASLRWLVKVPSIVLPNLILEQNAFPEFVHEKAGPEPLARALLPLLHLDSPERRRQVEALAGLADRMRLASGTPSERAATIILELARAGRQRPADGSQTRFSIGT